MYTFSIAMEICWKKHTNEMKSFQTVLRSLNQMYQHANKKAFYGNIASIFQDVNIRTKLTAEQKPQRSI